MEFVLSSLLVGVVEEGAEEAGVEMVQDGCQKEFVKLESIWKLLGYLKLDNVLF